MGTTHVSGDGQLALEKRAGALGRCITRDMCRGRVGGSRSMVIRCVSAKSVDGGERSGTPGEDEGEKVIPDAPER